MPSISAITPSTFDSGRSVTLTGSGFGASQGSVLIGGVAQNVNTWSDTSITFTTVRGSQSLGACRVDVVGGSEPSAWLLEDFSTYSSTANMLSDPRNIYSNGEDQNTADIALDTADGYAGLSQCMRYDWPDRSGICSGYTIGRNLTLPATATEVWVEVALKFSTVWSTVATGCSGISSPSYKLLFGRINGMSSRFEIVIGNGATGQDIWVGYPGNEEADQIVTTVNDLLDDQWHTFRVHWKVGSGTGVCKTWIDGVLESDLTDLSTGTATNIYGLAMGRNINQGPDQTQWMKWGRVCVFNTEPGWI